jgi:hypothetical protein
MDGGLKTLFNRDERDKQDEIQNRQTKNPALVFYHIP